MPFHYKALILVIVITVVMFALAEPLFSTFIAPEDYALRRNTWLALTVAAFVLPSFWLFIAFAAVLMAWAGQKDTNPVALYLFLLLVVPPIKDFMPGFGLVKYILPVDHLRVLSLVVLLPLAIKMKRQPQGEHGTSRHPARGRSAAGLLLVAYLLLGFALRLPYLSATANLRTLVEMSVDVLLPYFVVVYFCNTKAKISDAMSSFVLAAIVLAPLAAVEFAKGWILYQGIEDRWGTPPMIGYLMRGDFLRAQVTAGQPIVLGFAIAVAFGFWLYMQTRVQPLTWRLLGGGAIIGGLVATLAKGPWIGAFLALFAYQALGPKAVRRTMRNLSVLVVIVAAVLASPYADKIISFLPFVGDANAETTAYRLQLAEVSWGLVQQNPFFGTPFFMSYMEELRQGQGIIDVVNVYAGVALGSGLVGLALFGGFFVVLTINSIRTLRAYAAFDPDFSLLGAGLAASLVGTLLIIATTSYYLSIPTVLYALAALLAAYIRIGQLQVPASADLMKRPPGAEF